MSEFGSPGRGRHLHGGIRREGVRLLHAQCWVWGQDIRCAEGNLLLRRGFCRVRPPAGVSGCSQYTHALPDGLLLRIWGFGVYAGRETGVYLNRFDFVPRYARLVDAWTPEPFREERRCADLPLLARMAACIAAYEEWVEQTMGRSYRRAALQGLGAGAACDTDLAAGWKHLSHVVERVQSDRCKPARCRQGGM